MPLRRSRAESLNRLLYGYGLYFSKLKITPAVRQTFLNAWGGNYASRKDIHDQVNNLFTAMSEEFDEYNDTIDILQLNHQDAFFRAIFRRASWTRNVDQEELTTFIHYLIDAREQFLALPRRRKTRGRPLARAIQHFMDLYQQRGKGEEMKAIEAMEQSHQKEQAVSTETTAHDEEREEIKGGIVGLGKNKDLPIRNKSAGVVGPSQNNNLPILPIRNKSGSMVSAPDGPCANRTTPTDHCSREGEGSRKGEVQVKEEGDKHVSASH